MNAMRSLRDALDRLTLYLPLLVMVVLAMGSWWLVRAMPEIWSASTVQPVRKDPDYHLENFSTQVFDVHGRRIRQVGGEKARHYPDTDELHIDGVTFSAVDESGVEVTGSARRGIATGDGERLTLIGQVHVLSPAHGDKPKMEFRGEHLLAWTRAEKLRADAPVDIWRGSDHFSAQGLDFDIKTGQYQLTGRVRGVLLPQAQKP